MAAAPLITHPVQLLKEFLHSSSTQELKNIQSITTYTAIAGSSLALFLVGIKRCGLIDPSSMATKFLLFSTCSVLVVSVAIDSVVTNELNRRTREENTTT